MNFKKSTKFLKTFFKSPNRNQSSSDQSFHSQMSNTKTEPNNDDPESAFECNICLETAKDAVVSLCGHLFCWPCLHLWLETKPNNPVCPVCKAAISASKVIPIYGKQSQTDPRKKFPPRPKAQRTEPQSNNAFSQGFNSFGFVITNLQLAFGGVFPFAIIASSFGDMRHNPTPEDYLAEREINKVFLFIGIIFIIWLIFA